MSFTGLNEITLHFIPQIPAKAIGQVCIPFSFSFAHVTLIPLLEEQNPQGL